MLNQTNLAIVYHVSRKMAISFAENLYFLKSLYLHILKSNKKEAFHKASIFIHFQF